MDRRRVLVWVLLTALAGVQRALPQDTQNEGTRAAASRQESLRQPPLLSPGKLPLVVAKFAPGPTESRPAISADEPSLALADLERLALQFNPTLAQAAMAVKAAQGDYVQAGLYPNPVAAYVGDEINGDGSAGLQGGGFSQEIVTAGKRRLGQAVASREVQQSRFGWETQQQRVLNDVRVGYYETLMAQKLVEVNEQLFAIENRILDSTRQLRAAAEVSEVDVLQASVEVERAALNLSQAKDLHLSAWRRLMSVVGRPEMESARLAGDVTDSLPVITWDDALARLLTHSPELAQASAGVERARSDVALQYAQRIPNVEVATTVKRDTASGFTVVDLGVAVPLPVFDRNQGNIVRAYAALTAAKNEVKRVELDLYSRLAATFQQYVNARRRAETYVNTILPNAKKSLDLTQIAYREGEFEYLTLLTTQRTYYDLNLEYLASLEELWSRSVELEGMLLRGGLEPPGS